MPSEFELIRRYFTREVKRAKLGVGDDCALLAVPQGQELVVSTDMLVSGVHFLADTRADWLGHKALAVNLSDLAAMGATPRWAMLALSLPAADENWLKEFSRGLLALADIYDVELVGGDTTKGPLNICITVGGEVPAGQALRRDGAQVGDDIWVTGTIGDAALSLAGSKGEIELRAANASKLAERLHQPQPRIEAGIALRGVAHAAIDISDGLAQDLGHILERSDCGAEIDAEAIPRSPELAYYAGQDVTTRCQLAGGDDYELCFTAPASARGAIEALAIKLGLSMTRIGRIEAGPELKIRDARGNDLAPAVAGFDHFR
jgi:thiamine-monophosphate kinase